MIEQIAAGLQTRGFLPRSSGKTGSICFTGDISCHGEKVLVEIEIDDFDLIKLPKIRVLKRPQKLSGLHRHLGANDELCYADKNEVVLDRHRPAEAVVGCLDKATALLNQLTSKNPPRDFHDEFSAYWPGHPVFLDVPNSFTGTAAINFVDAPFSKRDVWLVSSQPTESAQRLSAINWKVQTKNVTNCFVISTKTPLIVDTVNWPPRTIGDFLRWLEQVDSDVFKKIYRECASKWIVEASVAGFLLRTPSGDFGCSFLIDRVHAKGYRNKPSLFREYLLGRGSKTSIALLTGYRLDAHHVHGRNVTGGNTLQNKVILVAGCGTIGGFIASYLAKLGAGMGSRGKLILADTDILLPENIGRHLLGMDLLLVNKAQALTSYLRGQLPHLNIQARPVDVREVAELINCDLLIDATGDEAVSAWLNTKVIERRRTHKNYPSVVFSSIAGAGITAQAFLVDSPDLACYRCLWVERANGELDEKFPSFDKNEAQLTRIGCDSYMQYPVTTSVTAASLCVDLVLDWLRASPTPRLRRIAIDARKAIRMKNHDVPRDKNCSACRRN